MTPSKYGIKRSFLLKKEKRGARQYIHTPRPNFISLSSLIHGKNKEKEKAASKGERSRRREGLEE